MGRLAGIEYFLSSEAYEEEKRDMADIRRAKANLDDDYDIMDPDNVSDDPIREIQAAISLRIQGQFEKRVLRRSIDSISWEGKKLVHLPALHKHTVLLSLQEFEKEIHSELVKKMREE